MDDAVSAWRCCCCTKTFSVVFQDLSVDIGLVDHLFPDNGMVALVLEILIWSSGWSGRCGLPGDVDES
jgi:hypothetical protein